MECSFCAPLCVFKDTVPREDNQNYVQSLLPQLHTHSSLRAHLSERKTENQNINPASMCLPPTLLLSVSVYPTDTFQCLEEVGCGEGFFLMS